MFCSQNTNSRYKRYLVSRLSFHKKQTFYIKINVKVFKIAQTNVNKSQLIFLIKLLCNEYILVKRLIFPILELNDIARCIYSYTKLLARALFKLTFLELAGIWIIFFVGRLNAEC